MRRLPLLLLIVTLASCNTRGSSLTKVEKLDADTGVFTVSSRLDPTKPAYSSESIIRERICQGLGARKSFERRNSTTFVATCGGPTFLRREVDYPSYPQTGNTYLTFSEPGGILGGHGFQVSYFDNDGHSWLWYPGNKIALPENWKIEDDNLCFQHPKNTYNPVTKTAGEEFKCQPLSISRNLVISRLEGDVFNLATGSVPNQRDKCDAPEQFSFDRDRFSC